MDCDTALHHSQIKLGLHAHCRRHFRNLVELCLARRYKGLDFYQQKLCTKRCICAHEGHLTSPAVSTEKVSVWQKKDK